MRFTVQPQDDNRILLTVSKTADVMRVIDVTTRPGRLQFRLVETKQSAQVALLTLER